MIRKMCDTKAQRNWQKGDEQVIFLKMGGKYSHRCQRKEGREDVVGGGKRG